MNLQVELELTPLDELIAKARAEGHGLIHVMQLAQKIHGYLPEEILAHIADRFSLSPGRVYGVATFYSQFHLAPRGRHVIQQCNGTACHVRGAKRIIKTVEEELNIKAGGMTDDMKLTYEVVYCLGSCSLAPAAMVDGQVIGRLTPDKMLDIINQLD